MRPPSAIRRITVAIISPPTFSKLTWIPSGVADASAHAIRALVVDRSVEAELLSEPAAFPGSTSDTYCTTALDLGDLARDKSTAPAAAETTIVSPDFGRRCAAPRRG